METEDIKSTYVTIDQLLEDGPAYLWFMDISAGVGGATIVTIYNSRSAVGEIALKKSVLTSDSKEFNPVAPLYCEKGIYIDVDANILGVLVQTAKVIKGQ